MCHGVCLLMLPLCGAVPTPVISMFKPTGKSTLTLCYTPAKPSLALSEYLATEPPLKFDPKGVRTASIAITGTNSTTVRRSEFP